MKSGISVFGNLRRLRRDREGAVYLEFTLFVAVFFSLLFGVIEFMLAFYQWNAATKAVQYGARLAAVSSPVAAELKTFTGLEDGANPGDPMPSYKVVCDGSASPPACTTCEGDGLDSCTYDAAAMATLVYGRGNSGPGCGTAPNLGMCSLYPIGDITPENVIIEYTYTGLGYAGRPKVPYSSNDPDTCETSPGLCSSPAVPTISVRLTDVEFQFYLLGGFMGFGAIEIPGLLSTVTGEDMAGG